MASIPIPQLPNTPESQQALQQDRFRLMQPPAGMHAPAPPTGNPLLDNPQIKAALQAQMHQYMQPPAGAIMPSAKTPATAAPAITPSPVNTTERIDLSGGSLLRPPSQLLHPQPAASPQQPQASPATPAATPTPHPAQGVTLPAPVHHATAKPVANSSEASGVLKMAQLPSTLQTELSSIPGLASAESQQGFHEMPAGATMPSAATPSAPPLAGTLEGDLARRAHSLQMGPGIENIAHHIEGTQFGQHHPLLGKLAGWGLQIPAMIGDIAAESVSPIARLALSRVPGTFAHQERTLGEENRAINQDTATAEKEAQTGALNAEIPLRQAEAEKAQVEAQGLPAEQAKKLELEDAQIENYLHPAAKTAFEDWRKTNPTAPTADFFKAEAEAKPQKGERPDTPEQQFIDEYQQRNKGATVADAVHAYAAATQKPERGPTVIQTTNEADKVAARLGKPYETAGTQGQGKLDRIDQTLRSLDAGYVGQGLAIPELLTSLVSGQGTGVRITQPELNMITAHRGIKGNAESFFNSLAGKGNLTDTDKKQMREVLNDAKVRLTEKLQLMNDAQDAINAGSSRADVVAADKKYRGIQLNMEKYREIRRDDAGNWYGSNDGGKTTFNLETGKEAK